MMLMMMMIMADPVLHQLLVGIKIDQIFATLTVVGTNSQHVSAFNIIIPFHLQTSWDKM